MSTYIQDYRRVTDVQDGRGPRPVPDAADPATEQVYNAADPAAEQIYHAADTNTQRSQDSMVQLVRQGLDTSLKSVQVWADLARQVSPTALGSPASATIVSRAYDPFEVLLAAQREVVGELVATQRQLTQQVFGTTVGDHSAPR